MELSPEEIEDIRREELGRLQDLAKERDQGPAVLESTPRMEDRTAQHLAKQREIRSLKKSIEAEFWRGQGYKRYVTRHGKEIWLTPEELKERKARRRRHKRSKRSASDTQTIILHERIKRVLLYLAVLALGIILGLQLV